MSMDQEGCNLHVRRSLCDLVIGDERQGVGVGLAEACERRDLGLEVTMNGPSNDFMDLGKRKRCGSLRRTHRVAPFFLLFDVTGDAALGFFEERGLDFAEAGFFEADFDGIGFFKTDLPELALDGLAEALGDSVWAWDGDSASRRWT